jgi:LMBR1 domain-containing protein 1
MCRRVDDCSGDGVPAGSILPSKIVVCCSIFVAIVTVLMFPLDVANRQACSERILFSDCELTLPMREMWYGVYIANIVLVYLVTPFTLFYYEADSELCASRHPLTALRLRACARCGM